MTEDRDTCACGGTLRVHTVPVGRSFDPAPPGRERKTMWRWDHQFKCDGCGALYQSDPSLTTLEPQGFEAQSRKGNML